jgi:hypothetical protein
MADFNASFKLQLEGDQEIKKKFEDLEQTLQDVKKAAEDTTKPLEDTAKGMQDLGKSAGDVDKNLDGTAKKLDDVSKSASDIKKDMDDVDKAFVDTSKSAVTLTSDLKDADSGFSDIASNADGAVSSMDAVKSSFVGISESAVEADQNIQAATTGLEGVGTATESAAAGADALVTSLDNIAASAQEAETNISAAANGIDGIGTSIGQAETALDGLGSAFDGAGTATTTFNDVLTSTGTQAQAASGGLTPLNTVLGQTGTATQQAQTGFQGFNSNLATMTGFLGVAASGALQFATSLSNLHGAQIKVEATQGKLSAANEAVAKAQEKLNGLYTDGTASAKEIEQATLDLQQALEKQGIANERAGKAQDDLNIKYAKFATDTLPQLIQTVTGTIAVLGTMKGAISSISMAGFASTIMTVGIPALAALYAGLGVFESVPALFRSVNAAIDKDTQGMVQNLTEFLSVLERFASILPGLGGAPLKLAKEALQEYAKSQGVATEATDGSIKSLLDAGEHSKNLNEAYQILTGSTDTLGKTTQAAVPPTKEQAAAIEGIKGKIEGARAGIDGFVESQKIAAESSNTLTVKLHEQNEGVTENINQTMALVGSTENYNDALLTVGQSIADHQVKIDQLNQTLGTAEGQQLSFTNAVLAGEEKFLTWVQTTQDAAVEAATFKGKLDEMANTFGGLPGWIEPTVENIQAYIRSNKEGGEASKEFARISLESYRGLVEGAKPLFDDLKSAWTKIYSGEAQKTFADALAAANDKIAQNVKDNEQAIATSAEGTAPKIKSIYDGVDWESVTAAMKSPFAEAFEKLPPMVQASLDETERAALTFSAQFANIAEQAGSAWANNLKAHVDMGETFPQAIAAANQAALDIITPFVQEHPETAQMIQPLLQALQSGTPQAVQEALTSLAGMQGPFQEQAQGMLTEWNKLTGQMPTAMKTGVENSIDALNITMTVEFEKIIGKLDTLINTGIKQDPANVPLITANVNPANEQIQSIGTSLTQLKQFLEKEENKISIHATETNPLDAQIQLIGTSLQQVKDLLAVPLTVTVSTDAAKVALDELNGKIDAMAGKNVAITVNTGPAGIAITGLQGQIDAVHGKEVAITVNTGPAGIAITTLQGDIDAVHGTNVFITVDTGSAGTAIREIQGQIDGVHGTNVYITVDTSGAQEAIRQLQTQINSLQQSMSGIGTGYNPGYQSPYGSYLGAYGGPGYAKGFGPAIINKPTRMLVGEAGPELVSVIPIKNQRPASKTAAAGMGWYGPAGGGLGYGGIPRTNTYAEAAYLLQQAQGGMQQGAMQGSEQGTMQGSEEGTQQGMQQSQPGMQDAVQQGAMQGTQQGYQEVSSRIQQALQQGNMAEAMAGFGTGYGFNWSGGAMGTNLGMGGGGAQYPTAPSNTEIWGAGRFTWGGGAAGAQLGGGNMGGAQYPTAGVPLGPEHAIGFGSRPVKYTWGGGASGTTLTPTGPHVGAGLPGPDPYAFGGGGGTSTSRGVLGQSYGGSTMGQGYRMPGYEGTSDAEYERRLLAERDRIAAERGTTMGQSSSKTFVKAFDAGVEGQSQNINGVSATILSGNAGPARQAGNEAGTAAGQGFAQGFNDQMGNINTSAITQGQAGYPKAYTGEVPASYGKPLGQLINGIAATILPGQGPRGPPMQAAFGMHQKLRRDTLIQAHRNERVDISPGGNATEAVEKARDYANATMDRITALLEKLLSQGSTFKVDFNVDGRKMSSVAAKHMGTTGYGDK